MHCPSFFTASTTLAIQKFSHYHSGRCENDSSSGRSNPNERQKKSSFWYLQVGGQGLPILALEEQLHAPQGIHGLHETDVLIELYKGCKMLSPAHRRMSG